MRQKYKMANISLSLQIKKKNSSPSVAYPDMIYKGKKQHAEILTPWHL